MFICMNSEMNNEYYLLSTSESHVWVIPAEHDGTHRTVEDAEELIREQYADQEPNKIWHEGTLNSIIEDADKNGIALLRD